MALSTDFRSVATTTAVAGNTVVVTGLGFQPKVLIAFGTDQSIAGNAVHHVACMGAGTSSTNRGCVHFGMDDALTTSDGSGAGRDDSLFALATASRAAGTGDGRMDIQSLDADGYTLVIDEQFTASALMQILALGGADLTNVATVVFQAASGTGNQAVTGAGFAPDTVLFFGSDDSATINDIADVDGGIWIGAGKSSSNRFLVGGNSNDADPQPVATGGIVSTDRCLGASNGTIVLNDHWDLVSLDADGFTINRIAGAKTVWVVALCLKGLQVSVGTKTITSGATGNQSWTGVGFQPKAGLWFARPEVTAQQGTTMSSGFEMVVGAATSSTARGSIWLGSEHNASPSNVNQSLSTTRVAINQAIADGTTDEGTADFVSFDADGYTWNRNTAWSAGVLFARVLFGDAAGAGGGDVLIQGLHGISRGVVTQTAARLGGVLEG